MAWHQHRVAISWQHQASSSISSNGDNQRHISSIIKHQQSISEISSWQRGSVINKAAASWRQHGIVKHRRESAHMAHQWRCASRHKHTQHLRCAVFARVPSTLGASLCALTRAVASLSIINCNAAVRRLLSRFAAHSIARRAYKRGACVNQVARAYVLGAQVGAASK